MQAVAEIRAIQPTGPHHLAGYSFGGLVAFAASQLLSQAGYEVGSWRLSERRLPKGTGRCRSFDIAGDANEEAIGHSCSTPE